MRHTEHSQARRLVTHMCVQGYGVLPGIRYAGASYFSLDVSLPVRGSFGRSMETVLRDSRAINILIEEPVHPVIAVEIHCPRHVLFHDSFEVFSGSGLVIECLAIILHHVFEKMI